MNIIVEVPSIKQPITRSPGFAKKGLSTWKLDLMALCGFGCRYCSSNTGNYLRINRERFADITADATGKRLYPTDTPELSLTWPDVLDKLALQLRQRGKAWGAGETLVLSMLTDAFSGPPLHDGTTERALRLVLDHTSFRVRVLTKNSIVGTSRKWLGLFADHADRVVVGLSCGTLDAEWAKRVEIATPPPQARIAATRALQDAGVPTFGMLCPIFPDVLDGGGLERLIDAIRPERCETVWAEPFNDRDNWRTVRDGYEQGSGGRAWFDAVYESGERDRWSLYASALYMRLRSHAGANGWTSRLAYLLYEGEIAANHAHAFDGFAGVLLQDPKRDDGKSRNPHIAALQHAPGMGCVA